MAVPLPPDGAGLLPGFLATDIGVKGPEHAISYAEALTLRIANAVRLCGEENLRSVLIPGCLADLTVWGRDPAQCHDDALRDLNPTHTFVVGLLVAPTGTR